MDPLGRQTRREVGGGRRSLDGLERAVRPDRHEEFADVPIASPDDPVDRQRIHDFIRQDRTDDRPSVVALEDLGRVNRREAGEDLALAVRRPLCDPVSDHVTQARGTPGETTHDARSKGAGPGPVLSNRELGRTSEALPELLELARHGPAEDRVGLRSSQEVRCAARTA